ncbi:low-density lipoprotein receptor class A domain-containing protein 1 isoform X5 [Elephas maximus indicus]|uniref:low-density lipoprotein receptor class A domain-containing protein 1 isoform X5 n=1 Tax=Elephas maximus indicus TaxID=99487 RepID=UPI00211665AC|nr:low-density lipoprotein receptor class A domain-containing protein 1 isoform X5 [Elephas maximus indicus]
MNKIFPQGDVNGNVATETKALPGGKADCGHLCCSRQGACLSASILLLLATLAALIVLVVIYGLPPRTPGRASCAMTGRPASQPVGSVMASAPVFTARMRMKACVEMCPRASPVSLWPTVETLPSGFTQTRSVMESTVVGTAQMN